MDISKHCPVRAQFSGSIVVKNIIDRVTVF